MSTINIGARSVGDDCPALLIAEVAQAHDGSLGIAHSFIDAAAHAGADAVKFQTHIAAAESTIDEPFRVRFSRQDETRYEYWQRMEFSAEQWKGLADHAASKGLIFLSSAFSIEAVDLLERIGVPAWKVGSGEFRSQELVERMAATGKPLLLSTGMSRWDEIEAAIARIEDLKAPAGVFQCTSRYPTPLEEVGLNVIDEMRQRFTCPVGLSDHSGQLWPALAAIARGAHMIEAHITFDRRMFGPDTVASLTTREFRQLADARDAIAVMQRHPVDKDSMAEDMSNMRSLFTKSIALAEPLPAGTILVRHMLTTKKPGTGIAAADINRIVGRKLRRPVPANRLLQPEDLDD